MSETGAVEPRGKLARLVRWPMDRLGELGRGVASALPRAIEDLFRDRCTQYAASIAIASSSRSSRSRSSSSRSSASSSRTTSFGSV
jgi:hypothetical protein